MRAALLVCLLAPVVPGCDDSTGTPPELSQAEIEKRQADELAARQKAYGKNGVPTGRNPGKAAKAAAKAGAAEKATP